MHNWISNVTPENKKKKKKKKKKNKKKNREKKQKNKKKKQDSDGIKLAGKDPFILYAMDYPGLTLWKNDWKLAR